MADEKSRIATVGDWVIRDNQTQKQMSFHLYNGLINIQIRGTRDRSPRPMFSRRITKYGLIFVRKAIDKVVHASPETKLSVSFKTYEKGQPGERTQGTTKLDWVFVVEKDSKQCFKFHITDVGSNQTWDFLVRGSGLVEVGSEPMSDSDRSQAAIKELQEWFEIALIWAPTTYVPFNPGNRQSNYQRGGGYSRPQGGGYDRGGGNGGGRSDSASNSGDDSGFGGDSDALPF